MNGLEIFLTIVFLIALTIIGIKLGKHIVYKIYYNSQRKKKILKDIQDVLDAGVNAINSTKLTDVDIKKLKIQKEKFLNKSYQLISEIADTVGVYTEKLALYDKLLNQTVTIDILPTSAKITTDIHDEYNFTITIIKDLIENNKFPEKEDYIKLNNVYKKYKKLNKFKT